MQIAVSGYSNAAQNVNENSALADVFKALGGSLATGTGEKVSSNLTMSSHAATTEIYDSLGSKHEIKFEWRKVSYSPENGTEWSVLIQVPEPGVLNADGSGFSNVVSGSARFNNDGTLLGFTPTTLSFTANNGSAPGQGIELNFGKIGDSNGLRSNDNPSATDNITQDGYAAGNLVGTRVDEAGTIIGSFSNGRSFGLAQVSLAVFSNNEGLESRSGNIFSQTANSGDPIFGAAGTSRRGTITASALEMSNVDLSRALTQLIVVQRGYQANSKTITTSDQMLTSLLQIKQ
jgi:flagellar hook protein FlgE